MVCSNEPGYYEDGAFGVRIENLVVVVERDTPFRWDVGVYGLGGERGLAVWLWYGGVHRQPCGGGAGHGGGRCKA